MERVFSKYLRDERGQPFGFVAVDQYGCYGISLCSPRDRFNKALARKIALGRLAKNHKTASFDVRIRGPKEAAAMKVVTALRISMCEWQIKQAPADVSPVESGTAP